MNKKKKILCVYNKIYEKNGKFKLKQGYVYSEKELFDLNMFGACENLIFPSHNPIIELLVYHVRSAYRGYHSIDN